MKNKLKTAKSIPCKMDLVGVGLNYCLGTVCDTIYFIFFFTVHLKNVQQVPITLQMATNKINLDVTGLLISGIFVVILRTFILAKYFQILHEHVQKTLFLQSVNIEMELYKEEEEKHHIL